MGVPRAPAIPIDVSNAKLRGIQKEWWHARGTCFLVRDRRQLYLLLTQKLGALVEFINKTCVDHDVERVSPVGLYEIANAIPDMGRSKGLHKILKMWWRVQTCELNSEAIEEFEAWRPYYKHAVVIGDPACYSVAPCA